MLIVYDSRTGYGEKFARKLSDHVQSIDLPVSEPCLLVTRNEGLGQISEATKTFLTSNAKWVEGVVVNGMKRFGPFFNKSAGKLQKQYGLEIIAKIELDGTDEDVLKVQAFLKAKESA